MLAIVTAEKASDYAFRRAVVKLLVFRDAELALDLSHAELVDLIAQLRNAAKSGPARPAGDELRVERNAHLVFVFVKRERVCTWVARIIPELLAHLNVLRLEIEEELKKADIARDSAILLRAGAEFVLSSRPDIQAEAVSLAATDSQLRRYMPGIPSQERFGVPVFEQIAPKKAAGCE